MQKVSSGLLMYRKRNEITEVFLVHPGGPFWEKKDYGVWSIPKGEMDDVSEDKLDVAIRELEEETGIKISRDDFSFIQLGEVKQKGGKTIYALAFENNWQGFLRQNFITIEWPYKSGKFIKIPEIDKAQYFKIVEAKKKINPAQVEFIDRLQEILQL